MAIGVAVIGTTTTTFTSSPSIALVHCLLWIDVGNSFRFPSVKRHDFPFALEIYQKYFPSSRPKMSLTFLSSGGYVSQKEAI